MKVELYLTIPDTVQPELNLEFNGDKVMEPISSEVNEHGHYFWIFDIEPKQKNLLKLYANGLGDIQDKTKYVNIVEIIIDGVNFDLVHNMNCRAQPNGLEYQLGATQLDNDGYFEIPFETPVWKYWCDILSNFRYEDYPNWQ